MTLVVGKDGSTATLGDLFAEIDQLKAQVKNMISAEQVKQWEADVEYWRGKWHAAEQERVQWRVNAETLAQQLTICRIRCERAEKRLAQELRKRGELKP